MSKNKQPAKSFRRKTCVIATEIAISLLAAPLAFAQQATEKVEKLEITGSRIPSPTVEGTSPVAVISAEDIKFEGVKNVENMLNNLPQVFAEYGASVSNGATGTATVNLRNLGSVRTLVLVNGKRLPPGSPAGGTLGYAADLNQIPASLIKRVDVLTGGASAVYGSDAVAGVVNFIMDDRFQGVQAEVNHSFYNHQQNNTKGVADVVGARAAAAPAFFAVPGNKSSDGKSTSVNLTLGSNFADDKGNAVVFFGYKKDDPLLQSERDFSACSLSTNSAGTAYGCGGSSTSFPGRFLGANGEDLTVANAQGGARPFASSDIYNFGPLNYFQRPSERYSFNAFAHMDITPSVRAYSEFSFHDDHTVAQIAPSGLFGLVTTANFENPLLSQSWRDALALTGPGTSNELLILRRNVEGGGRQDDIRHSSYRGVIGLKGDVFKNWNYDVYATLGRVVYQETYKNDFSITRSGRAMDVVTDPATGLPACRSAVDGSDTNCVPYNIWTLGGVTPEALAYLQTPGFKKGFTSQSVVGGTLSADLGDYGIRLPMAKSGAGIAFGYESRKDELQLDVDSAFATGDLFGQGGPTGGVDGSVRVRDYFLEGRLPIIEGKQMAQLLSLNGSFRRSDYDKEQTNSFGIGLEWAPVKHIKARGSYQKAVRAANVIELFTPQGVGLYNNDADPCAGATPSRSLAECARTGVTAAQYGHIVDSAAGQYNGLFGGNPDLSPETAKSRTLGLVFEPSRDLNFTFDYFNIKVEDVIGNAPPTTILDQCLDTGSSQFCGLIQRDQLGTLWATQQARIVATNLNLAQIKTSGLDVTANYTHKLPNLGSMNLNFVGTYLKEFITEPIPGLGDYDCAGFFGPTCGTPLPEWRHKLRATWSTPWNADLALTWRFMGEVKYEGRSSNPLLAGTVPSIDDKMKAMNYFDIAGSWYFTKNLSITGGVNNLLDTDPPIVNSNFAGAPFGNGNTYPVVYDALGRKVFLTLTAKF